jgi:hypothetical protein
MFSDTYDDTIQMAQGTLQDQVCSVIRATITTTKRLRCCRSSRRQNLCAYGEVEPTSNATLISISSTTHLVGGNCTYVCTVHVLATNARKLVNVEHAWNTWRTTVVSPLSTTRCYIVISAARDLFVPAAAAATAAEALSSASRSILTCCMQLDPYWY